MRHITFGGNRHGLSLHTQAILAMYASKGIHVVLVDSIKTDAESNVLRLKQLVKQVDDAKAEAEFAMKLKTTAFERRNSGQKWWRQFSNKKRKHIK